MSATRRIALASTLALVSAPLHAAPSSVVVPDPSVAGELDAHRRDALAVALTDALTESGFAPVRVARSCTDAACLRALATEARAERVVVLRTSVARRDWVVTLEVYDAEARLILSARESCAVCGFGEVQALVAAQAAALRGRLDALSLDVPILVVTTDPPGARAFVDDVEVGTTPLELPVAPGTHRVRVTLPGHVTAERVVEGAAGLRTHAALELAVAPASRRASRLRAGGWSMVGIGAAALVVGPTLIGVHGRDDRTRCSGDQIDADGDCAFVLATRAPGIAVTVAGAVLVTVGLILARHRRFGRRVAQGPAGPVLRF